MSKYSDFFHQIGLFRKKQDAQKQRGLNDYNLLTTVLSPHDEVRLHSRVIHSLLDPQGLHYQGALFLELFLEAINFEGFDCQGALVAKEYKQIDLYLTDKRKHIIIENKIWAGDQENQIKRYLEIVKKKNIDATYDDILVIYLSVDRGEPSGHSLGGLKISGGYVSEGNERLARYKSIHYKKEILSWLTKCKYEIQNISNLNESLNQYINVVNSINNININKIMQLSDYLRENLDEKHINIIEEILITFQNQGRDKIVKDFFEYFENTMVEKIKKECNLDDTWSVHVDTEKMWNKCWQAITIGREIWFSQTYYVAYGWEVEKPSKGDSYYGIFFKHDESIDMDFSHIHNKKKELFMSTFEHDEWWPLWAESYNPQSVKALLEFYCNKDKAAEKIAGEMIELIKHTKHDVEEINRQLMTRGEVSE